MSYVQDIARDALKSGYADLVKARRGLLLAAGVLALIHLLTVHPYLDTSREIASVETSMDANDRLLARLAPEIEQLKQAGNNAGTRLDVLLSSVTNEMIDRFADLRARIAWAMQGEPSDIPMPPDLVFPPDIQSQQQIPQMQMQQMAPVQQMAPPGGRDRPRGPNIDQAEAVPNLAPLAPELPEDDLQPILEALVAEEPDAQRRLTEYARETIVAAAYARAQRAWSDQIRPEYLEALSAIERQTRQMAESAPPSLEDTVLALQAAAADIAAARGTVEAIEITSDASVDAALGSDWWRTVSGKGAFADAIADSINAQMRSIAETAESPSLAIGESIALQEELRDMLRSRQERLESEFAEQRKQLASLSGAAGVVPIDLASFIGLFPLVVGLVLGLMLMWAGQARRQGAQAAEDLADASPDDAEPAAGWRAGCLAAATLPCLC